jgi:hypothetical protein
VKRYKVGMIRIMNIDDEVEFEVVDLRKSQFGCQGANPN